MMDLTMCRAHWFNKLVEKRIPCGCICIPQAGGAIAVDAGVNCPGGWRAGKYVLQMLTAGLGEVVLETVNAGGEALPVVSLYLDDPAAVYDHYLAGAGEYGYCRSQTVPADGTHNCVVASHAGLVDYMVTAGKALPLLTQHVLSAGLPKESMLWGYGRTPILLKGKTEAETARDKEIMQNCGAVAGLWVKAEDSLVKEICAAWKGPGEVRLHNTATGNTFIAGKTDEEKLLAYLTPVQN